MCIAARRVCDIAVNSRNPAIAAAHPPAANHALPPRAAGMTPHNTTENEEVAVAREHIKNNLAFRRGIAA
jgi:hypothetical protein